MIFYIYIHISKEHLFEIYIFVKHKVLYVKVFTVAFKYFSTHPKRLNDSVRKTTLQNIYIVSENPHGKFRLIHKMYIL